MPKNLKGPQALTHRSWIKAWQYAWILNLYKDEDWKAAIVNYMDEDFSYSLWLIIDKLKDDLIDA